jgi:FkbM family methyltransferase
MIVPTPYRKLLLRRLLKATLPKRIWNQIREGRATRIISKYQARQVCHTYAGFLLNIYLADPMAESWYNRDWGEYPEFALLRRHLLRQGSRVFDIGAHQCVVALILANIVGSEGLVVAVEANHHNATVGEHNRQLNCAEQLRVVNAAVSDKAGTVNFNVNFNGQVDDGTGEWGQVAVKAVTVDDLTDEYGLPDVLFLDVEGFECQVLRGAERTLKGHPDCFVEVHVRAGLEKFGGSVGEVISFFPTEHYDLFMCPEVPHDKYVPLDLHSPVIRTRFFLVALSQR